MTDSVISQMMMVDQKRLLPIYIDDELLYVRFDIVQRTDNISQITFVTRLVSFSEAKWLISLPNVCPERFAINGLYYLGRGDLVSCFFCGIILNGWTSNDTPEVRHRPASPKCAYLNLLHNAISNKDNSFISVVIFANVS